MAGAVHRGECTTRWWVRCALPTLLVQSVFSCTQPRFIRSACGQLARRANQFRFSEIASSPDSQKIFRFCFFPQISGITRACLTHRRGARDRHERAVGCDGRRSAREARAGREAYGEVVWFGRRGAGVKSGRRESFSRGDGGKRAVLREEHEVSRKAIAQGRPGSSSCPVRSCAASCLCTLARGTAVQQAPYDPCAL